MQRTCEPTVQRARLPNHESAREADLRSTSNSDLQTQNCAARFQHSHLVLGLLSVQAANNEQWNLCTTNIMTLVNVRPIAAYRRIQRSSLEIGLRVGGHLALTDFGSDEPQWTLAYGWRRRWQHTKCLPILLYALEACSTNRTLERSLEFSFTRILMKIFRTRCKDTVTECAYYFGLQSIADLIKKRKMSFLLKFVSSPNSICQLFVSVALCETKLLKTQWVHIGLNVCNLY